MSDVQQEFDSKDSEERVIEIKFLKLITGENLITFVYANEDDPFVTVIDPILIHVALGPDNQLVAATMDWLPGQIIEQSTVQLHKDDILALGDVTEQYREFYMKLTNAKVMMRQKKVTGMPVVPSLEGTQSENSSIDDETNERIAKENAERLKHYH